MTPPPAAAVATAPSMAPFGGITEPSEIQRVVLANSHRERLSQSELDDILGARSGIGPGRPGNLTPFQEAKLREIWLLACKTFGVYNKDTLDYVASLCPVVNDPTPSLNTTDSSVSTASKKSRGGFFSRKKKDDEPATPEPSSQSTSGAIGIVIPDVDTLVLDNDKHGSNKAFKSALDSYSGDELRRAFWEMVKADHPDALLLRFLRARKWDVKAAFIMAVAALHWRLAEYKVDSDIMKNGEMAALQMSRSSDPTVKKDGEDFLKQLEMAKNMLLGVDKEGRPVSIVRVKLHKAADQSAAVLERFTVYAIETSRIGLRAPVDTATIVFDMTDFGLANMDYAPVKFMIKCFEANYPESLGAIFIHKAPWIFSSIWNVIKGWLDPVVASKVNFTKDTAELSQFISMDNLHHSLGGNLKYEWKYTPPVEGENDKMLDTAAKDRLEKARKQTVLAFEEATIEWVIKSLLLARGDNPQVTQDAVDDAMNHRHRLAKDLRSHYWALDPYIRARSFYDRLGTFPRSQGANNLMRLPK